MKNVAFVFPQGPVVIGRGILDHASEYLNLNRRVLIVADSGVPLTYANKLAEQCADPTVFIIPQGEASKSIDYFQKLLSVLLNASFDRNDCVVAVGGGVAGDLSAFVASCYMRGVDFYNIPTTFLAQIDSSIGGKTAIDFEGVKNIVGSFYPAKQVLTDPNVLFTLSDRQMAAGIAEAIKIAAVRDIELFEMLENCDGIRSDMTEIIGRSAKNKLDVVEEDPREKGVRKILNFGHTIGHGIESYFNGELLHGECVALGMLPMCSNDVRARLITLYKKFGLPFEVSVSPDQIVDYIRHDKKSKGNIIKSVYCPELGHYEIRDMTVEDILFCMEGII